MRRIIYLLLASLALSGCCFSCGSSKDSARRTYAVGKSRIEATATSFSYDTPGANRGDWGGRAHSVTLRARVDERPDFEVGTFFTPAHLAPADLEAVLGKLEWRLSDNGQHLSLESHQPLPSRFYLLPSGGPAFSVRMTPILDESRTARDILREALAARIDCANNRNLFRAVSFSGDDALQRELLRACVSPGNHGAPPDAEIDAALTAKLDNCAALRTDCDATPFELCLAARGSRCHASAVAFTLNRCSPTTCHEVVLMEEYATPEELARLEKHCGCP